MSQDVKNFRQRIAYKCSYKSKGGRTFIRTHDEFTGNLQKKCGLTAKLSRLQAAEKTRKLQRILLAGPPAPAHPAASTVDATRMYKICMTKNEAGFVEGHLQKRLTASGNKRKALHTVETPDRVYKTKAAQQPSAAVGITISNVSMASVSSIPRAVAPLPDVCCDDTGGVHTSIVWLV